MPKLKLEILKDMEMDQELKDFINKHRDKPLNPKEMDLSIQSDRVVYVLSRTLARLNVVAYLPALLENKAELLRQYLPQPQLRFILDTLNSYGTTFDMAEYPVDQAYFEIRNKISYYQSVRNIEYKADYYHIDPEISQVVDFLFYNHCIQRYARSKPENSKVDRGIMSFIKSMEDLKNAAKLRIYVTGEQEEAMEKELRRAYKSNALLIAAINELKAHLEQQRKQLGDELNKKVAIFEMYNKKMETVKEDFESQMRQILHESEKIMMHKSIESEEQQIILAEQAKVVTQQFENLLEDNLNKEKKARTRRFKIETQLQNWLTKFDQDVGDKQNEINDLQDEYDKMKADLDDLQDQFDDQEIEYNTLMAEKDEEQQRLADEIAGQFFLNYSARVIQRGWRNYLRWKMQKKKKGKGKKGISKPSKTEVNRDAD